AGPGAPSRMRTPFSRERASLTPALRRRAARTPPTDPAPCCSPATFLPPRRRRRVVDPVPLLRDDPLQVQLADGPEQVDAAADYIVQIPQSIAAAGHDAPKPFLPGYQRELAQIAAVQRE